MNGMSSRQSSTSIISRNEVRVAKYRPEASSVFCPLANSDIVWTKSPFTRQIPGVEMGGRPFQKMGASGQDLKKS